MYVVQGLAESLFSLNRGMGTGKMNEGGRRKIAALKADEKLSGSGDTKFTKWLIVSSHLLGKCCTSADKCNI